MQGPWLKKYGVQTTVLFDLPEPDGVDLDGSISFAAGDVKISKDGGALANTTNLPTDEGTHFSLVLTAAEMQAGLIVVELIDTVTKDWLDTSLSIQTFGDPSADLSDWLSADMVDEDLDYYSFDAEFNFDRGAGTPTDYMVVTPYKNGSQIAAGDIDASGMEYRRIPISTGTPGSWTAMTQLGSTNFWTASFTGGSLFVTGGGGELVEFRVTISAVEYGETNRLARLVSRHTAAA